MTGHLRLRRRSAPPQIRRPEQGDVVVDAFVRARLLGLSLLTLEASVVVWKESGPTRVRSLPLAAGAALGLERAVELVEQGADTLERSRNRSIATRSFVR